MKLTVLSDNRLCGSGLRAEHGLSLLLQTERACILLDTGGSDAFVRNAERLGVDLAAVDYVFLSHGHNDHTGGLRFFAERNGKARLIVSPAALHGQFWSRRNGLQNLTIDWPEWPAERLILVDRTCEIAPGIRCLAAFPHPFALPRGNERLLVRDAEDQLVPDDFRHELALYVDGFLFTGCAHNGLENILTACPWPVHTVAGGFHLLDGQESPEELSALARQLRDRYPDTRFYTGHCTGDQAFAAMKPVLGERLQPFSALQK